MWVEGAEVQATLDLMFPLDAVVDVADPECTVFQVLQRTKALQDASSIL